MAQKKEKVADKIVKFEQSLKCDLTEKELKDKGTELSDVIEEGQVSQREFDEVKSQFKGRIDGAKARAETLASIVRAKSEYRTVKCERVFDFDKSEIREVRTDTGATVGRRELTDADRQQHLPIPDAD